MNYLFFDCTNEWIIISSGKLKEDKIYLQYNYKGLHPRESSYKFITEIDKALKKSEIKKPDILFCCIGPGSFTGIRICVSTARNFSQIWNLPVMGMDSIETYSAYYYSKTANDSIVLLKTSRDKFFAGHYGKLGYTGSFDIKKEEMKNVFSTEQIGAVVYSNDNAIDTPHNMNLDIPDALYAIESLVKKRNHNGFQTGEYSYRDLLPNYLRASYAEERKDEQL